MREYSYSFGFLLSSTTSDSVTSSWIIPYMVCCILIFFYLFNHKKLGLKATPQNLSNGNHEVSNFCIFDFSKFFQAILAVYSVIISTLCLKMRLKLVSVSPNLEFFSKLFSWLFRPSFFLWLFEIQMMDATNAINK